jgi:hypothetical protein
MSLRRLAAQFLGRGVELKAAVAAGAAANTPISVPGIKRGDVLVAVLELQPPTATSGSAIVADRAGQTTVGNGSIQIATATTGNQLLILYWSV